MQRTDKEVLLARVSQVFDYKKARDDPLVEVFADAIRLNLGRNKRPPTAITSRNATKLSHHSLADPNGLRADCMPLLRDG